MKQLATISMAAAFATVLASASFPLAAQLDAAAQTSQQTAQETEGSQRRIDQLDTQTQALLNDYRANLKQLEQLTRYNASQERQVVAQQREMASLRADIENVSSLQRSVQPLIEDMLAALGKFIEADIPFQPAERSSRLERLEALMDNPDQSAAQRYRLIVEAYQIENEYGRTIEAYRGDVEVDGTTYENAEFLRIGRLALMFKTDDDAVLKIYDREARSWENLDRSFLGSMRTGLRMAKEQIPPDLLTVPVSAPIAANGQGG
jgi:septal ring factor EnvC (AmiA/AmiB activator)